MKSSKRLAVLIILLLGLVVPLKYVECQSALDQQPSVVKAVAPVYPAIAMAARVEGKVTVEVKVGATGEVKSAKAIEEQRVKLLRAVAEKTALRWQFSPTTNGDKERTARLVFVFRIVTKDKDEGISFSPPYQVEVARTPPVIKQTSVY